ncbi:Hypothetical predicted protein [Mytilus galloprovincialis]|uniref:Uncharacterized protein n=1 Tax=Mytilus galloprovincialis TaxID=29158 RepID=A0A8B6CLY1_MYTGA|nr:Hypothetical predicted protein [Mytilus galloprovincialis]
MDLVYQTKISRHSHKIHESACNWMPIPWQQHYQGIHNRIPSEYSVNYINQVTMNRSARVRRHNLKNDYTPEKDILSIRKRRKRELKSSSTKRRDMQRLHRFKERKHFVSVLPFNEISNNELRNVYPSKFYQTLEIQRIKQENINLKQLIQDKKKDSDMQDLEVKRITNELQQHKEIVNQYKVYASDMDKFTSSLQEQNQELFLSSEHSPYQNQQIQNELETLKIELNDSNRMKNYWEDQTHINFRECNEKYAEIDGLEQQIKQLQSDNFELVNTIREIENNQNQMVLQQQRHTNHRTFYTRNRQSRRY